MLYSLSAHFCGEYITIEIELTVRIMICLNRSFKYSLNVRDVGYTVSEAPIDTNLDGVECDFAELKKVSYLCLPIIHYFPINFVRDNFFEILFSVV